MVSDQTDWDMCRAAAYTPSGELVIGGAFFSDTITLGGPPLDHSQPLGHIENGFVVKYGADRKYLWGKPFGGALGMTINGVALGPSGEIFVVGRFQGTVTFGALPPITAAVDPANPGVSEYDAYVAKLDADGKPLWAKSFGNPQDQRAIRVAADSHGNVIVEGAMTGKVDFGNGALGDQGTSSFVAKLDGDGKTLWTQVFSGYSLYVSNDSDDSFEMDVAVDAKDDVIASGAFGGNAYFGSDLVPSYGGTDAFVVKLAGMDGSVVWHQSFHGGGAPDGDQWISALAPDPCTGDVYVAGAYRQGIKFGGAGSASVSVGDGNDQDMFLGKLSGSTGAPIWFKAYGDSGRQNPVSLKVDAHGSLVMAGNLIDGAGVDFGPGIGVLAPVVPQVNPTGQPDAFIVKLDPEGKGHWGKRFGDQDHQKILAVATDASTNVGIAGVFVGTIALGGALPVTLAKDTEALVAWFDP